MKAEVDAFFDDATSTVSYLVTDPATKRAAVIDSVLDYEPESGRISTTSADAILTTVEERGARVVYILETHIHADHLTAAAYLRDKLGAPVCIGDHVGTVQQTFREIYHLGPDFPCDGSQFDRLLADGERLPLGEAEIEVMHLPGHTPACSAYKVDDAVFVGDTIFMPDFGSARCDFPGGDPRQLHRSVRRLFALPDATRLMVCHDYAPGGRDYMWETMVGAQKAENIHLKDYASEDEFVRFRTERDATLSMPALILPAVQVNIRAGRLPEAESNGMSYLKIPVNGV